MRVLLLSDIHANSLALNISLEYAQKHLKPIDAYWVLGDVLGRGPFPLATWTLVESLHPQVWLAGNHDWYVGVQDSDEKASKSLLPGPTFRKDAVTGEAQQIDGPNMATWDVILRHRESLSSYVLKQIQTLDCRRRLSETVYVAHAAYCRSGGTNDARTWLEFYIKTPTDAEELYGAADAPWHELSADAAVIHISGHTHEPGLWQRKHGSTDDGPFTAWSITKPGEQIAFGEPVQLKAGNFYHINPGSVGMPYTRVCFPNIAVLDTEQGEITFYQVDDTGYDVEVVRDKMRQRNYPPDLYSEIQMRPCR